MLCISSRIEGARSVHDAVAGTYQFPTAIEPCTLDVATDVGAALDWVRRSKDAIESRLASTGALVFRGFPLDTAEDFAAFTDALGYPNFAYAGAGGNAVRKNVVGDRVFTANESPPEKVIPFHNELAQCPVFPHRVLFFCDVPAAEGGATPLLDCHRVYVKLRDAAPAFMDELEAKGVRYTRVTTVDDRPSSAVGRGWAGTFGVSDAAALEAKLEGTGQTVEWLTDVDLRRDLDVPEAELDALLSRQPLRHYSAPLSAVRDLDDQQRRRRPEENKRYFFNQIMAAHLGWRDELNLPGRSVVFGDGGAIPEEAMDVMARIFEEEAVAVPWRHGDVMLLDNLQVRLESYFALSLSSSPTF